MKYLLCIISILITTSICCASQSLTSEEDDSLYLFNRGMYWYGDHTHKGLDTLRLYVERHPFATKLPGEVTSAISETIGFTGDLLAVKKNDWIEEYNWLAKVQPANSERVYQSTVIEALADCLTSIDRNAAANMWYNYSLLFNDSSNVAYAWKHIKSIRDGQKQIPEDTTAFTVLTFPLTPLAGVKPQHRVTSSNIEMSLVPNPATTVSTINIELPKQQYLTISIYDLLGRRICEVASDLFEAGGHSLSINVRDLSPGTYYVRLEHPKGVITKSLIIEH